MTWLTAAVDKRVVAASPMVMSMLNYHEVHAIYSCTIFVEFFFFA